MVKINNRKAQAAIELAVFGAILIFILGTIIRTAVGNSYQQNQTLKTMRMAMLASYKGSQSDSSGNPNYQYGGIGRNSSSIMFLEDRLSPDVSKYGTMARSSQMASGSGSFSYQMLFPMDATDVNANLPIEDVYINGQHFPFTTAAYANQTLTPTDASSCVDPKDSNRTTSGPYIAYPLTAQECRYNQCLRNAREWVTNSAGTYKLFYSQAVNGTPQFTVTPPTCTAHNDKSCKDMELSSDQVQTDSITGQPYTNANGDMEFDLLRNGNYKAVEAAIPPCNNIPGYYCPYPNICGNNCACSDGSISSCIGNGIGTPTCTCVTGSPQGSCEVTCSSVNNGKNSPTNNPQYSCPQSTSTNAASCLRADMAWQWSAAAGTSADNIGLDPNKQQFPSYDIDGRLKTVTIYSISTNQTSCYPGPCDPTTQTCASCSCSTGGGCSMGGSCSGGDCSVDPSCENNSTGSFQGVCTLGTGAINVSYEDPQGGDIDSSWDINSCTPKPGLKNNLQIFSFVNGAYLQVKEGKLYNPQSGQAVSSVNQHNSVDLIQREIQLSNNTGRFCPNGAGTVPPGSPISGSPDPDPVEVCVDGVSNTCFSTQQNIKSTCYDLSDNMIFVRSRLTDRRGRSWLTDATGQLGVQ